MTRPFRRRLSRDTSQDEIAVLDGVTAGTVTASKALVVDSSKDLSALRNVTVTNLDAGASGTAGTVDVFPTTASKGKLILSATANTGDTSVTVTNAAHGQATVVTIPDGGAATSYVAQSTAALSLVEVDQLDVSAMTETTIASGTASVSKRITNLDSSGGAGSFTLAAPAAAQLGMVKIIQMTTAGNALTLALTNVQGGSAATTASFDAVNETLVLIAGTNKWTVLKEVGVTLS
jgi:hypothetical protein